MHGQTPAIERRIEGQNAKGEYTVTVTKSLHCKVPALWATLLSKAGLEAWLQPLSPVTISAGSQFETRDGFFGDIRTMKKNRRVRMTWQDPNWEKETVVQITLVRRPNGMAMLVIDHSSLKDLKIKSMMRARWKGAADAARALIAEK